MGWLSRIFPGSKPADDSSKYLTIGPTFKMKAAEAAIESGAVVETPTGEEIPAAKVGLNGEFDESGLAKRVVHAFDLDAELDDIETLWVAQLSSKVVLKGKVPTQAALDKAVSIAMTVPGATSVDTSEVTIG